MSWVVHHGDATATLAGMDESAQEIADRWCGVD